MKQKSKKGARVVVGKEMVYNNLVKNSISAYFAAVELHNKPNIAYRYETVTLLMMNAWELALKAYVKKKKIVLFSQRTGIPLPLKKRYPILQSISTVRNLVVFQRFNETFSKLKSTEMESHIFTVINWNRIFLC